MMNYLRETPWDKRNFGIDTYELLSAEEEALAQTEQTTGHFTLKVDPWHNKKKLHDYGFYYMDTLIKPACPKQDLIDFRDDGITISSDGEFESIRGIAEEAFIHGRFHRDFNIQSELADLRYVNWLKDLYKKGNVFFLFYDGEVAAFFAYQENRILLIGMDKKFRGRGLSKPLVSMGCQSLFAKGHDTLITSVSAINFPSLQMFYSLGFKMKDAEEVYHKYNVHLPDGV
ncbi:GNAT family N-acetyltransferase [Thalassobacillus pellis]|uniref:GNAT family N-acetyltransferase n=1 Tax=Thalassobacillus pellis TaxID=748008 RepID=UPI00196215F1|nr:GNAT family N-acetyltransferase [Thalassobacillus pellis]MBM7553805.1 GNAT superfamily N-acetyltransferase [Thalassobacillus pellis]